MKNILLSILAIYLIFFAPSLFGQKDYKSGCIITNTNDTICGFINLNGNYRNSEECDFKENLEAMPKLLTPNDIKGYKFSNGKVYVSKSITINENNKKVFLEFLVNGIVDLFYYKLPYNEYFFIEKDSTLYQLSNDEKELILDEGFFVQKSNQYIGILAYLFQGDPKLSAKIEKTKFDYKSLINITSEYHNMICHEYKCIDYTKSTRLGLQLEPNIGLINSWLGLKTSSNYAYDIKPVIGLNLRFQPAKTHYLWNFLVGISFSKNYFKEDFLNKLYNNVLKTYRIELDYSVLRVPIILEYSFPARKFQPFISAGYTNILLLNPKYEVRHIKSINSSSIVNTAFRHYQIGLVSSIGLRFKIDDRSNIFIKTDFEYRKPSVSDNYLLDFQNVKAWMINMGYSLKLH